MNNRKHMVEYMLGKNNWLSEIYYFNLMGFEIIGVQAQDTSPNVEIKNGPSTSNRP